MHIVSTINSHTRSPGDVPVFLLCFGEERVFVHKAETYEELERTAREEFDLSQDTPLRFETSSPDVCNGQNARITRRAFEAMWPYLDVISVAPATHMDYKGKKAAFQGQSQPLASGQKLKREKADIPPTPQRTPPVATLTPPRVEHANVNAADDKIEIDYPVAGPSSPRKRQVNSGKASGHLGITKAKEVDSGDEPEVEVEVSHGCRARTTKRIVDSDEDDETDTATLAPAAVPKSPSTSRTSVSTSLSAKDVARRTSRPPPIARDDTLSDQDWKEADQGNFWEAGPSSRHSAARQLQSRGPSQFSSPKASPTTQSASSPAPGRQPVLHATPSPNVTAGQAQSLSQSIAPEPPVEDQRFRVTIFSPSGEHAEFMTRGRHTVQKVLSGACKRFKLNYDSCDLYIQHPEDEDDEYDYEDDDDRSSICCPKTHSMMDCRISQGSILHVKVNSD
ncbi:hypothetical protein HGRIS_009419 [Hohenbuehelia grisea]|uniref:Rad60/SUMO-like domain-containing protein n=1 Tax=Hohenbuehelia grisea TaxID=104357 RepID=A0ABR3J171_9AGAR